MCFEFITLLSLHGLLKGFMHKLQKHNLQRSVY